MLSRIEDYSLSVDLNWQQNCACRVAAIPLTHNSFFFLIPRHAVARRMFTSSRAFVVDPPLPTKIDAARRCSEPSMKAQTTIDTFRRPSRAGDEQGGCKLRTHRLSYNSAADAHRLFMALSCLVSARHDRSCCSRSV